MTPPQAAENRYFGWLQDAAYCDYTYCYEPMKERRGHDPALHYIMQIPP